MPKGTWSLQDAKNRFGEVINAARRSPQTITKYGKPLVVIIDSSEYGRLQRLGSAKPPSLAEVLLKMPRDDGEFPRAPLSPREFEI
ncbi:MAG TPA: type II toxin-antitoxin system Phd/YefM family antitoxin [Bradyrhizobium sp.]|nr:type II toxin-antitoxin system Phd/YefM family antitoxin [Bradyrhizobium sp.]